MRAKRFQCAGFCLTIGVAAALTSNAAHGQAISISFMGEHDVEVPADEGAGYHSQINWNNVDGSSGFNEEIISPVAGSLVDAEGNPTEVTIHWLAIRESAGNLGGCAGCEGDQSGVEEMVRGNVLAVNQYGTVQDAQISLENLSSHFERYDVYVYLVDQTGPAPYRIVFDDGNQRVDARSKGLREGSPCHFLGYDDNGDLIGDAVGYGCVGEDNMASARNLSGDSLQITISDTSNDNEPVGIVGIQILPAESADDTEEQSTSATESEPSGS